MRGPIDYIVVGFEGKEFDGSILKSLEEPIEHGVIGLIAMTAIRKDAEGVVTEISIEDMGDRYLLEFSERYPVDQDVIGEDDLSEMSDLLEDDTTAAMLVVEQLWAKPLKKALIDANG